MTGRYTRPDTIRGRAALNRDGLVRELIGLGIDVPDDITGALTLIDHLDRRRSTMPTASELRSITAAALLADPDADVDALVDVELRRDAVENLLLDAGDRARSQMSRLLTTHANHLHALVNTTIASPAIAVLVEAAAIPPNLDAMTALRNGDLRAAETLAGVSVAASHYSTALRLRRLIFPKSDIDLMVCSIWANPNEVNVADLEPGARRWVEGCRRGGVMMYGNYSEVHDASVHAEAELVEANRAANAARWGTIGTPKPTTRKRAKAVEVEA
jgi:hypothetical protein